MARTYRKDKKTNKLVNDGKHAWRCRCEWCMSVDKPVALKKIDLQTIKTHDGKYNS